MNGHPRLKDPAAFLTFIHQKMEWQQERLQEMNIDPTGLGLVQSEDNYIVSAAKGLLITMTHVCNTSRA